jgi:antitoxin ParD1/3/4
MNTTIGGAWNVEVVGVLESVRLVQEREARLAALNVAIEAGLEDIEAGRSRPAEEVFDRLEAKYRAMAEAKHPK